MGLDPKSIFYIIVGSLLAVFHFSIQKLAKFIAHFWSVLVKKSGRKSGLKNLCEKFVEKIGQKLVKWPLSAHF